MTTDSHVRGFAVGPARFVVHFEVEVPPHVPVEGLEAEITDFVRQAIAKRQGVAASPVRPEVADLSSDVSADDLAETTWCGLRIATLNVAEAQRALCVLAKRGWYLSGWERRI